VCCDVRGVRATCVSCALHVSLVSCAPRAVCCESLSRQSPAGAAALRLSSARLRSARLARLVRWFVRVVPRCVGRASVLTCRQLCVATRRRQQRIRLESKHHRRYQVRDSVPSSPLNFSASRAERSLAELKRSAAALAIQEIANTPDATSSAGLPDSGRSTIAARRLMSCHKEGRPRRSCDGAFRVRSGPKSAAGDGLFGCGVYQLLMSAFRPSPPGAPSSSSMPFDQT
jgi:hypothetical protein